MVAAVNEIRYFICIVSRADAEAIEAFYRKSGVPVVYRAPCRGTATETMLDMLGVEPTGSIYSPVIPADLTKEQERIVREGILLLLRAMDL